MRGRNTRQSRNGVERVERAQSVHGSEGTHRMAIATTLTQVAVRVAGLAVSVVGTWVVLNRTATLAAVYLLTATALMVALWALAALAARTGVPAHFVVVTLLVSLAAPAIALTPEWLLYPLAGLGAVAEAEDLAARIRRARLLHLYQTSGHQAGAAEQA